jgi:hypothetical protein
MRGNFDHRIGPVMAELVEGIDSQDSRCNDRHRQNTE